LDTKKLALITSFGVLYYLYRQMTLLFLPPPLPDLIIFPVLIILSLSFLTVGFGGATYSSAIGGMLLSVTEASFVPFTIFLAILFGLTIDIFSSIFKAKINPEGLRKFRLALALVASSTVTGLTAFYATVTARIVQYQFFIDAVIIADGIVSGFIAGYVVVKIWNKYFGVSMKKINPT
jgi:hypothetical protein